MKEDLIGYKKNLKRYMANDYFEETENPDDILLSMSLLDITNTIENLQKNFNLTKNKKEKLSIDSQYILYVNEYHSRTNTKGIYYDSLFKIKK